MRVLIVEDELSLLRIISKRLKEEGYSVDTAKDGKEGLYLAETIDYDCIILDIMIPVIDGVSLLKKIRTKKIMVPVLFLTAKDSVIDRVEGLDSGADDYLVKPFSFDELSARIRALLRRQTNSKDNFLKLGDLTVDLITHEVFKGKVLVQLTSKEYAILEYLLRNKNRILTKSQIAEHVWNYDFDYSSNIVEVYIRYLRRKIDNNPRTKLIHTVRGTGYIIKEKNDHQENTFIGGNK